MHRTSHLATPNAGHSITMAIDARANTATTSRGVLGSETWGLGVRCEAVPQPASTSGGGSSSFQHALAAGAAAVRGAVTRVRAAPDAGQTLLAAARLCSEGGLSDKVRRRNGVWRLPSQAGAVPTPWPASARPFAQYRPSIMNPHLPFCCDAKNPQCLKTSTIPPPPPPRLTPWAPSHPKWTLWSLHGPPFPSGPLTLGPPPSPTLRGCCPHTTRWVRAEVGAGGCVHTSMCMCVWACECVHDERACVKCVFVRGCVRACV